MESVTSGTGRRAGDWSQGRAGREMPSEARKAGELWKLSGVGKAEEEPEAVSLWS